MTDWLHCNRCFSTPGASPGMLFLLGSCSHILCTRCLLQGEPTPAKACPCCRKHSSFVEIGRNMKPDLQLFFRSPNDLAAQFMSQLKKVMDFQEQNRARLFKFQNQKGQKMVKYAEGLQAEMKKCMEKEKKMIDERKQLEQEMEMLKKKVKIMEAELKKTRSMALFGEGSDSGFSCGFNSSLETSSSEECFFTSTPNISCEAENNEEKCHRTPSFFRSKDTILSPIARDSSAVYSAKRSGGADSEGSFCTGGGHDLEMGEL